MQSRLITLATSHPYVIYGIIVVLACAEGPYLSMICGFFLRFGYFLFWPLYIALMVGDLIGDVIGAFGRSKTGINFDALDEQPVSLIVLFLVPQGQFQKHLHTLANIAKFLHDRPLREKLQQAASADEMVKIIRGQQP